MAESSDQFQKASASGKVEKASKTDKESLFLTNATLGTLAVLFIASSHFSSQDQTYTALIQRIWLSFVALMPAFLVSQHIAYLSNTGNNWLGNSNSNSDGKTVEKTTDGKNSEAIKGGNFPETRAEVRKEVKLQYGPKAITREYYVPMLLNGVTGCLLLFILCNMPFCCGIVPDEVQAGVRYGGLGALVYVLMTLGTRSYQQDVTTGAAIWSAVQLILGPILGGAMATLLSDSVQVSEFNRAVFYFFAGLAPRQVVTIIQDVVRRFWSASATVSESKVIPLTRLRGITSEVEARLLEEGITDCCVLAMCNPVRLNRNTPFGERQIVAWMDEAFLHCVLPEHATVILKKGLMGVIDLAYYYEIFDPGEEASATVKKQAERKTAARIKKLADAIQFDADLLTDTIQRLWEDDQVRSIWTIYQGLGDGAFDDDKDDNKDNGAAAD